MTYTVTPGAIYSVLEPTLGVVNACLPTIKPAVSKIFGHQSTRAPNTGNIASTDSRNIRKSQNSKGLYTRQFERLEDDVTLIDIRSGPPSELAVVAAEFGRAGPPFSGVSTSRRRCPSALNAIAMPAHRPPRPLVEDRDYNANFVLRFTRREAKQWNAKRPEALTAEQRAALRKQLEDTQFLQPDYTDKTKINIAAWGTWREVLWKATWATAMDFLEYLCYIYTIELGRYMDINDSNEVEKDVANSDALLRLLTSNIKYNTAILSWEKHRIYLPGCYLGLAFTGARPAEFVDGERSSGKDGCLEELFPQYATGGAPSDEDKAPDELSRLLERMISQEYEGCGRPKALCYEDILLMVVRHPETGEDVLAMSIKLAHYKGADNKPQPTIFFFTPTRRLIFCFISIIVSLAVHDRAFAASKFSSVRAVFQAKNRGPVKCTPLRWKKKWLKRPVFRRLDDSIAKDNSISEDESDESDESDSSDKSDGSEYQLLPYQKLLDDMKRQSLDAGEENPIEPKAWRRGAANVANGTENEDRIRELTKLIASMEAQRRKKIRRAYREDYFYNRPTWDIEADKSDEEEYVEPAVELQITKRAKLAEILCNQPDNLSSAELLELRIQAAELMVALCDKRETRKRDRIRRRVRADGAVKEESPGPDPFPLLMSKKQCPRCIGDKTLSYEERTFEYCRPAVMYDHFDRKHAQDLNPCNHPKCVGCALKFKHLNHFKNHVERVHGVPLRP
ncbi:hypothetical protein N656DRAFT_792137 [Canariomyces notabilis]|uniref:C2H2-type domain-containing protein n=1 Tax=Canariomyces notabilis TaxID=2074819 RepID=A0AAN6T9K3_9PEZI|nr:hypothetical protein N656DRAFT_792137 [Canariomyces arenarius]